MKTCIRCQKTKTPREFIPDKRRKDGASTYCLDCNQKESRATWYYKKNPEKYRETTNKRRRELRQDIIDYYGGKCQCCGESTYEFLALDHKDGGGNKHRKEVGRGAKFYNWVRANNYPDIFRIMCHNCNMAIGFYGKCPHLDT